MSRRARRGFTYLELMVVVIILSILTAAIVPVYGASVTALKQRSVRGDLVASILYLQELSIHQSRQLRLLVDAETGVYYATGWVDGVADDAIFQPLDDRELGTPKPFPDTVRVGAVKARRDRETNLQYIGFYPNGACDPAEIELLLGSDDESFTIETTGALGEVQVHQQ